MRRALSLLTMVLVLLLAPVGAMTPIAGAQSEPRPVNSTPDGYDLLRPPSECIGFLPLPDCGKPPVDSGDRGGALQYITFAVIMGGLGFIFTVVFRNVVRRDRARAAEAYAAERADGARGPDDTDGAASVAPSGGTPQP